MALASRTVTRSPADTITPSQHSRTLRRHSFRCGRTESGRGTPRR